MASDLTPPAAGQLLVATPVLTDPNFKRSVILLCEHNNEGTFGFIINKKLESTVDDVMPDFPLPKVHLYLGGPVQTDTIYFLHNKGNLLEGSVNVGNGIFWGGNFEQLKLYIETNIITENDFRLYIGYSGWDTGQLNDELEEKSWALLENKHEYVFNDEPLLLWNDIAKNIGGEFAVARLFPENPSLN
jgi:putative transcriptional regulator